VSREPRTGGRGELRGRGLGTPTGIGTVPPVRRTPDSFGAAGSDFAVAVGNEGAAGQGPGVRDRGSGARGQRWGNGGGE